MGHLLVKLGIIDRKTLRRNEKEAKEAGKGSFYLAWVLDEDSAERDAGYSILSFYPNHLTSNSFLFLIRYHHGCCSQDL